MDKEQLKQSLLNEQDKLVKLQERTVARLQYIEGALSVIEELEKEKTDAQ